MAFGEAEEEVGAFDQTKGLGLIGAGTGKVRAGMADAKSRGMAHSLECTHDLEAGSKNVEGKQVTYGDTCSSGRYIIFRNCNFSQCNSGSGLVHHGPLQFHSDCFPLTGFELTNRATALQRVKEANEKWFGSGTFSFAGQKGT
jgi:U4/U6 small nuclear ribonucleoprotein PRP31